MAKAEAKISWVMSREGVARVARHLGCAPEDAELRIVGKAKAGLIKACGVIEGRPVQVRDVVQHRLSVPRTPPGGAVLLDLWMRATGCGQTRSTGAVAHRARQPRKARLRGRCATPGPGVHRHPQRPRHTPSRAGAPAVHAATTPVDMCQPRRCAGARSGCDTLARVRRHPQPPRHTRSRADAPAVQAATTPLAVRQRGRGAAGGGSAARAGLGTVRGRRRVASDPCSPRRCAPPPATGPPGPCPTPSPGSGSRRGPAGARRPAPGPDRSVRASPPSRRIPGRHDPGPRRGSGHRRGPAATAMRNHPRSRAVVLGPVPGAA